MQLVEFAITLLMLDALRVVWMWYLLPTALECASEATLRIRIVVGPDRWGHRLWEGYSSRTVAVLRYHMPDGSWVTMESTGAPRRRGLGCGPRWVVGC